MQRGQVLVLTPDPTSIFSYPRRAGPGAYRLRRSPSPQRVSLCVVARSAVSLCKITVSQKETIAAQDLSLPIIIPVSSCQTVALRLLPWTLLRKILRVSISAPQWWQCCVRSLLALCRYSPKPTSREYLHQAEGEEFPPHLKTMGQPYNEKNRPQQVQLARLNCVMKE